MSPLTLSSIFACVVLRRVLRTSVRTSVAFVWTLHPPQDFELDISGRLMFFCVRAFVCVAALEIRNRLRRRPRLEHLQQAAVVVVARSCVVSLACHVCALHFFQDSVNLCVFDVCVSAFCLRSAFAIHHVCAQHFFQDSVN